MLSVSSGQEPSPVVLGQVVVAGQAALESGYSAKGRCYIKTRH
jgi:hypothetical protein